MEAIQVVCAIIISEGKLLCAKRSESMSLPGYWEFPGGKIEGKETEQEALIREIKEELGVNVIPTQKLTSSHLKSEKGKLIELIPYVCLWESGKLVALEHEEVAFYSFDQAKKLNWAPADIPIFDELLTFFSKLTPRL
ncbi:(deoxy)nucleoside triphosphate pyrophosphohydrolase [Algoriphagus namhaensis]|uniref:8-oxo-dGTP diphosphatase n=1 Tax=Algoriphagus namhaensis TaxID=915353 RepID=A0ABV8ALY6_9BACT